MSELKDAFGTTNDMAIAEFMLENGSLHGESVAHEKEGNFVQQIS